MSVLCDGGQTGHVSDHAFVLQLCLGGLGLQAWRLQQETLWFGGAGESHPQCTHLFVALFMSQRDRLLILFPLILLVDSPPFLPLSSVIAFPSFLLAWMDNRGLTDES